MSCSPPLGSRELKSLPRDVVKRIDEAVRRLAENPHLGKPLRGELRGKWSLRVGDYRVIYVVEEAERRVVLFAVRHRRSAYR